MTNIVFIVKRCENSSEITCAPDFEIDEFIQGLAVVSDVIHYTVDYYKYEDKPLQVDGKQIYDLELSNNSFKQVLTSIRNN
jgi:hypothetical protein